MTLQLDNVTVTYPDGAATLTALAGVDLKVQAGEMVAITGESGSGKSTLLSVAAGLVSPTAGKVFIAGQDIAPLDEEGRARTRLEKIGIIFQQPNLVGALKVKDQLLIMDHLRGIRPREDKARELLSLVGLEAFGSRPLSKLSGGQRQRVNVARALMANPAVLLADEPTSALDSGLTQEITHLIGEVTQQLQTATLVVTHDQAVAQTADRQYQVKDGNVQQIPSGGPSSGGLPSNAGHAQLSAV